MPIYSGSNEIKEIWAGNSKIKEVWAGNSKVFSSANYDGQYIQIASISIGGTPKEYAIYITEFNKDFSKLYKRSFIVTGSSVCATYNINTDEIVVIRSEGTKPLQSTVDYYNRKTLTLKRSGTAPRISTDGYYVYAIHYHPRLDCYMLTSSNMTSVDESSKTQTAIFDSNFKQLDYWGVSCTFPLTPITYNALYCKMGSRFLMWNGQERFTGEGGVAENNTAGPGHPYDDTALFSTIFGSGGERLWGCYMTIRSFIKLGQYRISTQGAAPFYNPDNLKERWITLNHKRTTSDPYYMILNRDFTVSRYTDTTTPITSTSLFNGVRQPLKSGGAVVGTKSLFLFDKDGKLVKTIENALEYSPVVNYGRFVTDLIPMFKPLDLT